MSSTYNVFDPTQIAKPQSRQMSGGAMFDKKLDFAKDSVVPSSSYYMLGGAIAFAVYGFTCSKPSDAPPR
jgi:hypothetical protein